MSRREETSVAARSSATKRPAEEEEEGDGGEVVEEPKKKISFGLNKPKGLMQPIKKPLAGISIKLGPQQQKPSVQPGIKPKVGAAASVFSAVDDEDSEEEMPPEAKMRMKNIGRDTPTSAGPNSFGKTRMGFCDSKKIYEKQLKEIQEKASKEELQAQQLQQQAQQAQQQQNNGDHISND